MTKYLPFALVLVVLLVCGCSPKIFSRAPHDESAIADDIMNCKFFKEKYQRYSIENVLINKRQTDEENKTDKVFVTAAVVNSNEYKNYYTPGSITGNIDFVITYGLYNEGWILDDCTIDVSGDNGYGTFETPGGRNLSVDELMSDLYLSGATDGDEITDYYCDPEGQFESYSVKHVSQCRYATEIWQEEISYNFISKPEEYDEPGTWVSSVFVSEDEYYWHLSGNYTYNGQVVQIPFDEPQQTMTLIRNNNDWVFEGLINTEELSFRYLCSALDYEEEIAAGYSVKLWDGEDYTNSNIPQYMDFKYVSICGPRWPEVLLIGPDHIAILGYKGTVDNVGKQVFFKIEELEPVD